LFFFILKLFRIIIRIFSENILIIILGLELNMFRLIPLIKFRSSTIIGYSAKNIYFIFQSLGSIFFYFGILFSKEKIILFGLFKKIAGFPLIWFPFFLSKQKNIVLII